VCQYYVALSKELADISDDRETDFLINENQTNYQALFTQIARPGQGTSEEKLLGLKKP
jgi:hypothetical protein